MSKVKDSRIYILVAGLGAIGGYFGTFLAQNKNLDLCFLSRGKTLEHFKYNPLLIKSYKVSEISFKPNVSDDILSFGKKFDYVLVCVKSKDTSALIKEIKKAVHEDSVIVTLQNGIYNLRIMKKAFGAKRVLQAVCKIGVEMKEDYTVEHSSLGFMQIGEFYGKNTQRVEKLAGILKESGIDVRVIENMKEEFWIKFAWNTIYNSLTFGYDVTVDKLFERKPLFRIVKNLYNEISLVAQTQGVVFGDRAYKKIITDSMSLGAFKTSAYQDLHKGKVSEAVYFTSELLILAKKHGISVPTIEKVHTLNLK